MFIIMMIISLCSSTESMLAAFSSTKTLHNDLHGKTKKHTGKTLSARLIHRSSPDLPFYNPNYTRHDHIKHSAHASIARSRYFSQIKARSLTDYVAAPIYGADFYMSYTIGTPPVPRYGLFDTGSSFTWFQCLPCYHCYYQGDYPLYYPKKSSSYQQVYCDTYQCSLAPHPHCVGIPSPMCNYQILYHDNGKSMGIVSMDTLRLSSGNTTETLEDFVFGCSNDHDMIAQIAGIVGASNNSASLHSQLGVSHFSYFVFGNETTLKGEVHFGPGALLSDTGANTPMIPTSGEFYYLNLTGISVDGSDLHFPFGYFDLDGPHGGVIIDSGTPYTVLPDEGFEILKDAIAEQMYMYTRVKSSYKYFELCYKDYNGGAPEVVFQFSGLDFALCDSNLWVKDSESNSCLAMVKSDMTMIGMYQQRNVQVGYDLENNLLTLNSPDSCPDEVIDFMQ